MLAGAAAVHQSDWLDEARCLMRVHSSRCVVRLVGLVTDATPMYLVTELASRGRLKDCLRRDDVFAHADLHTLLDICSQVDQPPHHNRFTALFPGPPGSAGAKNAM